MNVKPCALTRSRDESTLPWEPLIGGVLTAALPCKLELPADGRS